MKRIMLTLILLTGIGGYASYAQSGLSLQECLKYALANNQQLASIRLEEDMGRFKTSEIRAKALPQVNGQGQYTNNIKKQVLPVPGELLGGAPGTTALLAAGVTHNVTASGTVTQEVFNQSVFTGLKAAKAGEEYYSMQTVQNEETLIYNVTQLYYSTLVSREKMIVLDANIEKLTKLLETTASQVQNGLARKIDLDRMRVSLTNDKTQRTQAQNQYLVQANQLKQQMGMAMSTALELPATSFKEIESKATAEDFGGINKENRIEYRLLKKQEELQEYQKKVYKAEYYPSLALSGNYSYNGISNKFDFLKSGGTANWYDMAAVSLTLKIPIFDGWARRSRVSQANVKLKQLNRDMEATTLSLNTQFENAKLQVQTNLSTIRAQKENVELADEVYNSTQNNYNLGLANLTDLLDAETSLTAAQNNYNEALLQYKLAELDIIKSNGNLKNLLN